MGDDMLVERIYSTISRCFAPLDEAAWKEVAEPVAWEAFLVEAFRYGSLPGILCFPPSYQEKKSFTQRYFVEESKQCVLPIHSWYAPWTLIEKERTPFEGVEHHYMKNPAAFMKRLIKAMRLKIPPELQEHPDHLSLELEVLFLLESHGLHEHARTFLCGQFGWLLTYRSKLAALGEEARFYTALIDLMIELVHEAVLHIPQQDEARMPPSYCSISSAASLASSSL